MFDCIVIGDVTIDTFLLIDDAHVQCNVARDACEICFDFGAKIPIHSSYQSIGGNAANVSHGLATLGANVSLLTEIGDDINGKIAHTQLSRIPIDLSLLRQHVGAETRYSVILNYSTDRTVFSYYSPRSYVWPTLPETTWIYYTSLGASFEPFQAQLTDHLRTHSSIRLAVNPGSYHMHQGLRTFKQILRYTDILFVNKEEAAVLAGTPIDITLATAVLHEQGVDTVVITDGDAGAYASDGDIVWHMPPYPATPVSKTGAGDAFASGCLAAHMHGKNIQTALMWGSANASSVIMKMGAQEGLCTQSALERITHQYPKIQPVPMTT